MSTTQQPAGGLKLPPVFFAVVGVAGLAFAAGVLGLFAPTVLPPLAHPTVAWSCLAAGVMLEAWAATMIFAAARERGKPAGR